jgi:A/G-specific adenine glycosylase
MATLQILALKKWFLLKKRSFPWRDNPSPYAVWISEIMLQQTRASVVVSYFSRWMKIFPTVEALALAPMEAVLKAWEGLGYYSRARNLKKAAECLVEQNGGKVPDRIEALLQMKGIGSYTAGAIASFAFHQKAAAVDANVARVIARYYGMEGVYSKKDLEDKTLSFLPDEEPWVAMEALIELGATLCQKKPLCSACPLQEGCKAFLTEKTDSIPSLKKKVKVEHLAKVAVIILHEGFALIEKKQEGKVLGGLIEFPSFPYCVESNEALRIKENLDLDVQWIIDLTQEEYSFTRYRVKVFPSVFIAQEKKQKEGFTWRPIEELSLLTFSSGHKRILQNFLRSVQTY